MRFGKSKEEAAQEPNRAGGGGDFIRYLKEGSTTFRILQEPDDWSYYWEHFSPAGFSFPCSNEDDCPGCTSENEKMSKVSRKIAFNVLHSFNGNEYVDVFKVGPMVADKLENRLKRFGTVIDRDYTITKYKGSGDRWDFDVEGNTPTPIDPNRYDLKDIETLLQSSWDEAWGDPDQAAANAKASAELPSDTPPARRTTRTTIAPQKPVVKAEEPPFERTYQESDLRAMEYEDLVSVIKSEMEMEPPSKLATTGELVDWLMEIQA